ncbi:DMT family transporter [Tropicibacter naphthalenivorans]|uniref:Phosphonate utilization associated putative membrane protein n=1 Tax=Tropicibacter naphthalenivorans TaxID=441103 RepID=A0A0P1GA38_9RHOB|nr:DMT family transporter [Tropicibacter naphthalenivorans]CUH78384.1 phosphonate utilization associated putative membrane protein [Tropicibacter naphthalenivorans]SMC80075.1 Permease of the drug/metabolite transporter (DMT) superfamily [Tropicibacter naphthalenivorans]
MTDNLRGALWMMLAMLGFGVEDAFFKAATATGGISPGMGTVQFGLTAMLIYAAYARHKGVPLWDAAYLQKGLLIRTGFEICGRLFFALALAYTPLSTTSAILQAAPLVVMLAAGLILGETIGPRRWAAMAVGFLGVLLIIRPSPSGIEANAILALLGMIGFAGRDVATRTAPMHIHSAQLGVLGFGVVTFAGLVIMAFEPAVFAPTLPAMGLILGTALCGVVGYTSLTAAMRTGEVSVIAPFRYSRLLVALILAYTVFGERPDTMTLAGAALIVGSGTYSLWRDGRARR